MANTRKLASRVRRIEPSPTLAVSARADALMAEGKDIINLSVGEPDFDTPLHIINQADKAMRSGKTKYTAVDGTLELRKAIATKFEKENQLIYKPNQILVSVGAKHSLLNLFTAVLEPKDEVIIPAPYWVSYPDMVKLMDANPVIIKFGENFKITPKQLEAAITPKTRLFIINSPSNPTGAAYTADELKALGEVLLKYPHVLVVSDDIYEHTLWRKERFTNILMCCPELADRCIVVNGVSKAYAMTGWRIGYAAGPLDIIAGMKKVQSQSTSNPASMAQAGAIAALLGDQSCIAEMTEAYKSRHDYLYAELNNMPGVKCLPSDGTFYCFANFEGVIKNNPRMSNDIKLAEYFLMEAGVALVPGSAFGAPNYLRFSYATSMPKLEEAVKRLSGAIKELTLKTPLQTNCLFSSPPVALVAGEFVSEMIKIRNRL